MGKIANQRAVIRRALRDYGKDMPPDARDALDLVTERMGLTHRSGSCTATVLADPVLRWT
ncbi:MAG: hypothetical protein ABIV25_06895 [Paracoccaceae bacterium]